MNNAASVVTSFLVGPLLSTIISPSRQERIKLVVHNETGTLFIKCGPNASATSYSYRLTANASCEISGYQGVVTAIKLTGTTDVLVTDIG